MKRGGGTGPFLCRRAAWAGLALGWLVCAFVRWRLLAVPLERDEGEYAYGGQLLASGLLPYEHLYNAKLPGIYAAYALVIAGFGESAWGIHLGLLFVNAATTLFVFLIARRLMDDAWGLASGLAFAFLSVGHAIHGLSANAEHFVLLAATAALWQSLVYDETGRRRSLVAAALLFGVALLMKQHGATFGMFGFLAVATTAWRRSTAGAELRANPRSDPSAFDLGLFVLGFAAPLAGVAFLYAAAGAFDAFAFWTFEYARAYAGDLPLASAPGRFVRTFRFIHHGAPYVWGMAAFGLTALLWDPGARGIRLWVALLCACSFLSVVPGFYFRWHYFLLMLPAVALLFGIGARASTRWIAARIPPATGSRRSAALAATLGAALVVAPLAHSVFRQRKAFFTMTPTEFSRGVFGVNPFVESPRIGAWIREHTAPGDRIVVFGSEPQIYFHAKRRASTGHIYTYPLTTGGALARSFEAQWIEEVQAHPPEVAVLVHTHSSWFAERSVRPERLLAWIPDFLRSYELALAVDVTMRESRFLEGEALHEARGPMPNSLEIYRRR